MEFKDYIGRCQHCSASLRVRLPDIPGVSGAQSVWCERCRKQVIATVGDLRIGKNVRPG